MTSDAERVAFERSEFTGLVSAVPVGQVSNLPSPVGKLETCPTVPQPFGAVLMPTAAQLDTVAYLNASRDWFQQRGMYERGEWDGRTETTTVLCQGYVSGGAFPLAFRPAKGEILTVRIPGMNEPRALNRGGWWLAPATAPPPPLRGRSVQVATPPNRVGGLFRLLPAAHPTG